MESDGLALCIARRSWTDAPLCMHASLEEAHQLNIISAGDQNAILGAWNCLMRVKSDTLRCQGTSVMSISAKNKLNHKRPLATACCAVDVAMQPAFYVDASDTRADIVQALCTYLVEL